MGTWSRPLFATVGTGSPDDYIIHTSTMSEQELEQWQNAAFLTDAGKTRWTLTEFMNTHCDTHKIIDHMDRAQIVRWEGLFRRLYAAYPDLTRLAFHFFCSDGGFPYYLTMDRSGDAKLFLCYGHSESYMYFRPRRSRFSFGPWAARNEESPEFMVDWYRRGYQGGSLDIRFVCLDSTRMLW